MFIKERIYGYSERKRESERPCAVKVRKYPRTCKWGLLFIMPWLVGFLLLEAYPLVMSLIYSFTDFSILKSGKFVGVQNYVKLFTSDRYFLKSLGITIKYTIISVPCKVAFCSVHRNDSEHEAERHQLFPTVYYPPSIMGGSVAIAILWRFMSDVRWYYQ